MHSTACRGTVLRGLSRAAGFSLVEVMVALVLLAGGLMGVAYMQNFSLRYGQESYHRSQIMVSAGEIIDSMRIHQIAADDGTDDYTAYTDTVTSTEAAGGCDPALSSPRNDTICFYQHIADNLPFGTARIAVQAADNSLFDISVFWSDRGLSQQADLSDAEQSDSEINLATQGSCEAAENRIWSADAALSFPFDNGPSTPQCLSSHTWTVQILNSDAL
jgi:type IV pilus assembly protein PilV